MTKNLRAVGDEFENICIAKLDMKGTYGSGANYDDADLKDDFLMIECKVKTTVKGVSIPPALINKVKAQATKWQRFWAIANRTQAGDFITLPLDTFAEIYEGYKDGEEDNEED